MKNYPSRVRPVLSYLQIYSVLDIFFIYIAKISNFYGVVHLIDSPLAKRRMNNALRGTTVI